jgi:hypothetical protein
MNLLLHLWQHFRGTVPLDHHLFLQSSFEKVKLLHQHKGWVQCFQLVEQLSFKRDSVPEGSSTVMMLLYFLVVVFSFSDTWETIVIVNPVGGSPELDERVSHKIYPNHLMKEIMKWLILVTIVLFLISVIPHQIDESGYHFLKFSSWGKCLENPVMVIESTRKISKPLVFFTDRTSSKVRRKSTDCEIKRLKFLTGFRVEVTKKFRLK